MLLIAHHRCLFSSRTTIFSIFLLVALHAPIAAKTPQWPASDPQLNNFLCQTPALHHFTFPGCRRRAVIGRRVGLLHSLYCQVALAN